MPSPDDDDAARERRMLRELKQMQRHELALSTASKKRLRIPKPADDNPFCTDRQLDDKHMLREFNKNPRLHAAPRLLVSPRTLRENPHNHSDINVPPQLPHIRITNNQQGSSVAVQFPAYRATIQVPKRHSSAVNLLQQRATSQGKPPVTFGHRPTVSRPNQALSHRLLQSASRYFDPVTAELNASAAPHQQAKPKRIAKAGGAAIGMSAESLKALLHPPRAVPCVEPSTDELVALADDDDEKTKRELEKGFNTRLTVMDIPKLRKESILNTPTDASVGELLAKYRKLAVGLT
ncbi:unnamed protein product [Aphanomyces euteiches]